ncbi:hypothetical protein [Geobacillus sp. TFV-3]|nr:hypothetical protein [Geobacillus sp. TFV-3]KAF0994391.1 hypothetical protein BJQ97_01033 [Geobacillus sp. TFV-3]
MKVTIIKGPMFSQVEKDVYAYLAKVLPEEYKKAQERRCTDEKAS